MSAKKPIENVRPVYAWLHAGAEMPCEVVGYHDMPERVERALVRCAYEKTAKEKGRVVRLRAFELS